MSVKPHPFEPNPMRGGLNWAECRTCKHPKMIHARYEAHDHQWVKQYDRGVVVKVVCAVCSKQQWEVE